MVHPIQLIHALRIHGESRLAIVGAGGKTTLMFRLAREYGGPVILTTSTHLAKDQALLADRHVTIRSQDDIELLFHTDLVGCTLVTGALNREDRLTQLSPDELETLAQLAQIKRIPVFIEADGSRRMPLKAPAEHEPVIPTWANQVVVVAGLSGLGQPLDANHVHRAEHFAEIAGAALGQAVTPEDLTVVLGHPQGGGKQIAPGVEKFVLLNQADTDLLQAAGGRIAQSLMSKYDAVMVAQLQDEQMPVKAIYTSIAGVVLAAGKSARMGRKAKVLLEWQGEVFVHAVARKALQAGLSPVVVVGGAYYQSVLEAVADLPVQVIENQNWPDGQSTSLISGVRALPSACGGAIFLLADQPQVTSGVLQALIEQHRRTQAAIIAPMVENQRANPVLFDRQCFPDLLTLQGDTGGRALFSRYQTEWLPWADGLLLLDVDTPADLEQLNAAYADRLEPHVPGN